MLYLHHSTSAFGEVDNIRDLTPTKTAINKQLNFSVKKLNTTFCILDANFIMKSLLGTVLTFK